MTAHTRIHPKPGKVYGMKRCRPGKMGRIFERGAGKWIVVNNDHLSYTSNREEATLFAKKDVAAVMKSYNLGWVSTLWFEQARGRVS